MRDLAQSAPMSLSGLYHHFRSKDELLFEIQRDAFERLLAPLRNMNSGSPEAQIEFLVLNHLSFFTRHITEMKVLSHELETLGGAYGRRIGRLRASYYKLCLKIVTELVKSRGRRDLDPRVTTMTLFGMINWIYRWYGSLPGQNATLLARQMTAIFLHGVEGAAAGEPKRRRGKNRSSTKEG
jgi:AcrR family transcriptional regulator